jgi:hypothetical protein
VDHLLVPRRPTTAADQGRGRLGGSAARRLGGSAARRPAFRLATPQGFGRGVNQLSSPVSHKNGRPHHPARTLTAPATSVWVIVTEASAAIATWTSSRSPSEQVDEDELDDLRELDEALPAVVAVVAPDESHDRHDGEPMST